MADSGIWLVDQIAAADLARDLGLSLDADALAAVTIRLAEHRVSAFDFAASRMHSKIGAAIQRLIAAHTYRSQDWSDGCRSAEATISNVISAAHREIQPPERRSKGQILRNMLRSARRTAAANPQYRAIDVPLIGKT